MGNRNCAWVLDFPQKVLDEMSLAGSQKTLYRKASELTFKRMLSTPPFSEETPMF
jgi:hypothetical protein